MLVEPFASEDQYEARYGPCDDRAALSEVLLDASREIAAELDRAGIGWRDPDEGYAERLMQACRSVANRAMGARSASVPMGATQYSQGAAGFTESYTLGNPYGEVYLSKAERRLLGLGRSRIGFAQAQGARP